MVTVPELSFYSAEQLSRAAELSPAFKRYSQLLTEMSPQSVHHIRHEAWMRCVLATYFGASSSETVCAFWSSIADTLLQRAWREAGLEQFDAGVFALGKLGSCELNLSSDIDLLVVADPSHAHGVERGLRRVQQQLHQQSDVGFCFRLDFDLRPGGKMGPLITTPSQFQDHYWSQGETWERLALLRLRHIAGTAGIKSQIEDLAKRFSFRKFLDFTLLDDLKALRSQVHSKGFDRRDHELHLKLEIGGIRDIELFVHSLLVLNGGKLKELQTNSTTEALLKLKDKALLPVGEADLLLKTYWYFRQLENLVQSVDDRQTHSLTQHMPALPGLADMNTVKRHMSAVDKIVSSLLGAVQFENVRLPEDLAQQKQWLIDLGFSTASIAAAWEPLINATVLSHKNDRDERTRQEFLYTFVTELARNKALDRDLGLSLLLDFVRATRAKASFFAMLLRSPRLTEDLARLFCLSPYLGSIVASRPELLDHFILHLDEAWSDSIDELLQQMQDRKLLTELWSANQFLADRDLSSMFNRITDTADSICLQLLQVLKAEFPAANLEIVTLGKWAGRELGLRSDLDFIFVSQSAPNEADFKIARRFISRLTDPAKGGCLFDLDLRLRPSGQSGPLLVAVDKLYDYWANSAQAWERQAYLRARPLNEALHLKKNLLVQAGLTAEELEELGRIRTKLLRPGSSEQLDIKYAPGGLLDIEFVTQTSLLAARIETPATATLDMVVHLARTSSQWRAAESPLTEIYLRLREFEQMLQLSTTHKTSEVRKSSAVFSKAASILGKTADSAWEELRSRLEASRKLLNDLDATGLRI